MKFAIIAAGEGSRLAKAGITTPKPLVSLNGEPMLDRLIRIFAAHNASSISLIINEEMPEVYEHIRQASYPAPLNVIRKSTPSSMHSFFELSHTLKDDPFCLTTVDTVFREDEFSAYLDAFNACPVDGLFAVTAYIDDEKPLYVETGENMLIQGFHDENISGACYASGGVYCLKNSSIPVLKDAIEAGMSKMRNYQRQLLRNGLKLQAGLFSKIIDVDRPDDIRKAELFLQGVDI